MKWPPKIGWTLIAAVFALLLYGAVSPSPSCAPTPVEKVLTKNQAAQLVVAIKGFYTEYGRVPHTAKVCVYTDSHLIGVLTGEDHPSNPRKIIFIELPKAKEKGGIWRNGLHPGTGSLLDAYGNPFLVKLDIDSDGWVDNPYADIKAGERKIRSLVIVWSSGKDGVFGNPQTPGRLQGSDDIISWK